MMSSSPNDRCNQSNAQSDAQAYLTVQPIGKTGPTGTKASISDDSRFVVAIITEANENDILCGKDKTYLQHPGNKLYHETILGHASAYEKLKNKRRFKMIMTTKIHYIMTSILKCRFLRRSICGLGWYQLSCAEARDKISHALRFMNRSAERADRITERLIGDTKAMFHDQLNRSDSDHLRPFDKDDEERKNELKSNSLMLGSTSDFSSSLDDDTLLKKKHRASLFKLNRDIDSNSSINFSQLPSAFSHSRKSFLSQLSRNSNSLNDTSFLQNNKDDCSNSKKIDYMAASDEFELYRYNERRLDIPRQNKYHPHRPRCTSLPSFVSKQTYPTGTKNEGNGTESSKEIKNDFRIYQMGYNAAIEDIYNSSKNDKDFSIPLFVPSSREEFWNPFTSFPKSVNSIQNATSITNTDNNKKNEFCHHETTLELRSTGSLDVSGEESINSYSTIEDDDVSKQSTNSESCDVGTYVK
jgi:hypothetical protein